MRAVWVSLLLVLTACGGDGAAPPASAPADDQAAEAARLLPDYQAALNAREWERARVLGYRILSDYRQTPAAATVKASYDTVKAQSDAAREARRLQSLWLYQQVPAGRGTQVSARIESKNRIRVSGGDTPVQLIFRDHPEWKRSTYVVLERGDIDCYAGCSLKVTVDGRTRTLRGLRPDTREAISMFVEPDRALWRAIAARRALRIEIPIKGGTRQTAEFEVGGLDRSKLPGGWN